MTNKLQDRRVFHMLMEQNDTQTVQDIYGYFAADGSNVYVRKDWNGLGYEYTLLQKLAPDLWTSYSLAGVLSVGSEFMRLGKIYANYLYAAYNKDSAGVTFNTTWSHTPSDDALGGFRSGRFATAAWAQCVTGAGVTSVGVRGVYGQVNQGVQLVTIDGDNTLADLLPTAQDLVIAGTLPDTVLIANGGTLNPTDRLLNAYNMASPVVYFTHSLTAGVHTVRLTITGYKQAAASATSCLIEAFLAWGAGDLYNTTQAIYHLRPITGIAANVTNPVWEISWGIKPTGASVAEWIGHTGSLKFSSLPVITVDGAVSTPAIGATVAGQSINFTMQFYARHSQTGATNLATVDMSYTLDAINGLTIAHTTTWLVGGAITDGGYPCMMTLDNPLFDRSRSIDTDTATISTGDGQFKSNTETQALWCWDADGNVGAIMYIPSILTTVNNWSESGEYKLSVRDTLGGSYNKIYARRFDAVSRNYSIGEIWQSNANYRIKWFDNPETVLS